MKVQTIRYAEQIGLMPGSGCTEGGQLCYGDAELDRLSFNRHSRQLGLALDASRGLLDLSDHPPPLLRRGGHNRGTVIVTSRAENDEANGAAN